MLVMLDSFLYYRVNVTIFITKGYDFRGEGMLVLLVLLVSLFRLTQLTQLTSSLPTIIFVKFKLCFDIFTIT